MMCIILCLLAFAAGAAAGYVLRPKVKQKVDKHIDL